MLTILLLTLFLSATTWGQDFYVIDMRMGLSESRVRQIQQMPDGRMAIATAANIDVYDGTRFVSYKLLPEYAHPLPDFSGNRQLTCDKNGFIWLRQNKQLFVVDANEGKVVDNVDSLMKVLALDEGQIMAWRRKRAPKTWHDIKDVTCIERDSYGGLWVGTKESGIIYYNPKRFNMFKTEHKTFSHGRLPNFSTSRTSRLASKYASQATNCTLDIPGGYAFLGTRKGLMVFDAKNNLIGTIDDSYGLKTNNIQAIIQDNRQRIWMATANTIVRVKEVGRNSFDIINYGELDGINVDGREFRTCQIHQDSIGKITVGFVGGIVAFMPDSVSAPRYSFRFPCQEHSVEKKRASLPALLFLVIGASLTLIALLAFSIYIIRKKNSKHSQDARNPKSAIEIDETTIAQLSQQSHELTPDEIFLAHVKECVEANISNEDFSVQMLGELMAMDRTGLYRRMLAVAGMSPSNYIKTVRMEVATRLLRDTQLPIADIAIKTGFSTTKYFNKVFKDTYHESPLEYRENGK